MPPSLPNEPAASDMPAARGTRPGRGGAWAWAALLLVVFGGTALFRFLGLRNGFANDHFVYISPGWQMQFGEWPTRDFIDPGLPLMFLISAAGQAWFGPSLLGEAVLMSLAFAAAAALTMLAVRELTGSWRLALLAAVLEVAIFPRTYGYPKMLAYALGIWVFGRYARTPTRGWLWGVAASVAVAFFFRHDHGLFLFVGAALLVMLVEAGSGWRAMLERAAALSLALAVLLLPYLVYVQANTGLGLYLQIGFDYSQREADRQGHVWPSLFGAAPLEAALLYEYYLLPIAAVVMLGMDWIHGRARVWAARVAPLAGVAVLANVSFLRDPLAVRLPDVIVPAVALLAWIAARSMAPGPGRARRVTSAAVLVAAVALSVVRVGNTYEEIDRAGLLGGWRRIPERFVERIGELRARYADSQMPLTARALRPFFDYTDRCTRPADRLLSVGFPPDIYFFARRRFAGGQSYFGSFANVEAQQDRVLATLAMQRVPLVFLPSDFVGEFEERFPRIAAHVRRRYAPMTEVSVSDDTRIIILADRTLGVGATDPSTGFPCFLAGSGARSSDVAGA